MRSAGVRWSILKISSAGVQSYDLVVAEMIGVAKISCFIQASMSVLRTATRERSGFVSDWH